MSEEGVSEEGGSWIFLCLSNAVFLGNDVNDSRAAWLPHSSSSPGIALTLPHMAT